MSMWPPRIIAKDVAESKKEAPGSTVTVSLPALMRSGSSSPSYGYGPTPRMPFSRLQHDLDARRQVVGDEGGQADAEVDVLAVAQLPRGARRHLVHGSAALLSPPVRRPVAAARSAARSACRWPAPASARPRAGRRCRAGAPGRGRVRRPRRAARPRRRSPCRPSRTSGLKLRAASWKTRLPCRSPTAGATSAKSATIDSSSTYSRPSNVAHLLGRRREGDLAVGAVTPRQAAFGDRGADAGRGEERGDAGAAGAQLLGERALRRELAPRAHRPGTAGRTPCSRRRRTR